MTTSRETGEKQRHEVIKYEQSGKLHWVCFQVAADSNLSETFRERERESALWKLFNETATMDDGFWSGQWNKRCAIRR